MGTDRADDHVVQGETRTPLRVFLSHTSELAEYPADRSFVAAAISAVVHAGHAVADMSYFSARDSSPADYCQLVVAASDVYVGIVANRYGSAVRDRSEQSYVEFEFSVATDIGLPRLIFLVRDDTTSLPPAVQSDDYRVRQDAYRYRLREAGLVTASVASPSELEIKLHQSLVELSSSPWEPVVPEPRAGVPPLLAANFVGREDELALLRRMLSSGTRVAIHGLGGVGKTQLAVKYADRHRADYPDGVFWLRAHEEMSLVSDLASLAWRLELPEREERKREYQVEAVLRWMRRHERWLLVLDNLMPNAAPSAGRWLPSDLPGHLLLTSRMPGWSDRVELVPWPQETARTFLLTRTRQTDTAAADAIAELLGCLPLALEQAAAYMEASGRNLAGYAALLRARLADLMDEGKPDEYPQPVSRTWQITLLRIAAERPATLALLRFCSFLAPDDIPVSVIQASAGELPHEMRDMVADDIELDRAIASLRRYSLLERQDDGLRVHRLVQAMSRRSMTAEQRVEFLTSAIRMLWATLSDTPREHPRRWSLYSRLLSHVDAVDQLATSTQTGLHELAQLLGRVGQYHAARSDFTHARQLHEREVSINERVRGRAHLETAASIHRLGRNPPMDGRPAGDAMRWCPRLAR